MKTNTGGDATSTVDDLEALQRHASDLAREADLAMRRFERTAWTCYATIFLAIPLAVVTFRLQMQGWHYALAGALFVAGALLSTAMDIMAMARQDAAERADRRARDARDAARLQKLPRK